MLPKTIIHLLSGGLDSVTLLYQLKAEGHHVHALLFDYHQQHKQELLWAKYHACQCDVLFTVMDLPALGGLNEKSWIVPNRNAVFLSLAINVAAQAKAGTVTIGCNLDDSEMFPDCRPQFIAAMNKSVQAAGYDVEICAPFLDKRKWEIGAIAREMGIKVSDIWTCYQGGSTPCGKCPACEKLQTAGL